MKVGIRKPSIKKSVKARTTGRIKRSLKSSVNPLYGKKGMGYINDPKKSIYNKIYNKTTVGVKDIVDDSLDVNTSNADSTPPMSILACIGAVIKLIITFVQFIFYVALLLGIIWFLVQVFKI